MLQSRASNIVETLLDYICTFFMVRIVSEYHVMVMLCGCGYLCYRSTRNKSMVLNSPVLACGG
jgi:hypothetical protein